MRTTIAIPEPLLEAVRRQALDSGQSLSAWVVAVLRRRLDNPAEAPSKTSLELPVIRGEGPPLSWSQIKELSLEEPPAPYGKAAGRKKPARRRKSGHASA